MAIVNCCSQVKVQRRGQEAMGGALPGRQAGAIWAESSYAMLNGGKGLEITPPCRGRESWELRTMKRTI